LITVVQNPIPGAVRPFASKSTKGQWPISISSIRTPRPPRTLCTSPVTRALKCVVSTSSSSSAFIAGAISSVAGGGTLVSFPSLIWVSLPSTMAMPDTVRYGPDRWVACEISPRPQQSAEYLCADRSQPHWHHRRRFCSCSRRQTCSIGSFLC
jgi:hypothetical protein